jgi:hypothetical protein
LNSIDATTVLTCALIVKTTLPKWDEIKSDLSEYPGVQLVYQTAARA